MCRPLPIRIKVIDRGFQSAFTLVELIVVVVVIAVVLAIALPSLAASIKASRAVRCRGNLHQLGTALGLYFNDHKDLYPVAIRGASVRDGYFEPFAALSDNLSVPLPAAGSASPAPYRCSAHSTDDPAFDGFSYVYRPWDLFALWVGSDPQGSISRVLHMTPQEWILAEADFKPGHGSRLGWRNDGHVGSWVSSGP